MKTSPYFYSQPNHLTYRTAIAREQKQFIKIAFAVHLSAVISAERYRSDSESLKSAVPVFVYFYIVLMVHKYRQSAKRLLLNSPTDRAFGNRRGKYKELGKKVPQAYRVYVEDTFLPCDAVIACIFSKEETGLYYYGARYLDPKYSRWLSGDPALGDYIPKAPIDDEAKKHNENLPGMGGVFNIVNLHVYHYAGNNPIKYIDPDGRDIINFIKGWFNYNLNKAIYSMNRLDYPLNPQFEMANEVLAKIDQMAKSGYNIYIKTLNFTSDIAGSATLLFLAIGQPELAAITGTIGTAADILLGFDNLSNGNYIEGAKGFAVVILSSLASSGIKKGCEKLGSLISISVGKNGLYYMKGRRGALNTIDGLRKQLYKDFVEGYFGEKMAPGAASQMADYVMKEILKFEREENLNE
ncbi:YD repeat-containing protein [Treponema pedis str. T A4]|uniref:YD repeat-containing protein n=1 Tax=Treponema pedis str. T A4 TaxID=1291379 RepID=S6A482_9SPIR|nr:RHS repeat-associated core domain-containing protein [Treponema pedis]AGT44186.1 YD repeat-containing protein [Treponema pedis str. T A4]